MAAQTQPRTPRDAVEFAINIPVTVALMYNQGKVVSGIHGERILFMLLDNRVMFLDPAVAGQIEAAGINVRENFTITQRWTAQKARRAPGRSRASSVSSRTGRWWYRRSPRRIRRELYRRSSDTEAAGSGHRRDAQRRAIAARAGSGCVSRCVRAGASARVDHVPGTHQAG